ncbi:MAG TPA: bifunctional YncE family protein/alkaline phosphatase family protein [Bryobacteraceae bacterium]|jgi:DNA-binding beta-propeller fold protein YncE|nr:bifunctional YncE family protein/alkaline phosphatase family protein [Bryobacteraceae bacterium]
MTREYRTKILKYKGLFKASLLASAVLIVSPLADAQLNTVIDGNDGVLPTPPGLFVTPTAPLISGIQQPLNPGLANYPNFVAGEAVKAVVSPDGTTLAILTAGQNSLYNASGVVDTAASTQFIFLYSVGDGNKTSPVLKQVIQQVNSHVGLVWAPNSQTLYAAGGCDDAVYAYTNNGTSFVQSAKISLGHAPGGCLSNSANQKGLGLGVEPNVAGLAITADGKTLVAANNYNDSISVIDTATATVRYEYDLRPYSTSGAPDGTKGGTFPYSVALHGTIAYVGADRDREVVVVDVTSAIAGAFVARIQLDGNPNGMTLSADGSTLYVAQDNQDQVAVISTSTNTITNKIDTRGPASLGLPASTTGAAPTAVTINPVNNTLYAVNAGSNSVAVIPLTGPNALTTAGLIPTAYDSTDIAFSADGSWMYIVNGKSDTGPNPGYGYGNLAAITYLTYPGGNAAEILKLNANNQYQFQLEHATLVSAQVPAPGDLAALTSQVAANNAYSATPLPTDAAVMSFLHGKIQHIIYVVKENRTFDQILGDLGNGSNGDPSLTLFGRRVTPSFHSMAQNFVTLDNFMDPGDGSMDGWSWSMRGRVTNTETITQQENYARVNRGLSYEGEGQNRNIPSNLKTTNGRDFFFDPTGATTPYSNNTASLKGGTPNILAGDGDHAATDGPTGYQQGYIFNAVLNAGGTVRNYGWMANTPGSIGTIASPIKDPFSAGVIQTTAANQLIAQNNFYDPYFRAYDQSYPDVWRFNEWNREFQQFVTNGNLPTLEMIRGLSHDHTGNFGSALGGVNTPELQQADNDYAVGLLVQTVASSPYANNTLIIIIEDDSQDGADHVDSHRATTYFVGPYVKHNTVVSTRYSQPSVLRTIEDILGTQHINLNTYYSRPMADVFDITSSNAWTFTAIASTLLKQTTVLSALPHDGKVQWAEGPDLKPTHNAKYWAAKTRGFDFSAEDRVPADLYNKILWEGLKGKPAPVPHSLFQKRIDKDDN